MKPVTELRDAALGWLDLIGRRGGAAVSRFNAGPEGLVTMLLWYLGLVILTRVIQGLTVFGAVPAMGDIAVALALNAMPMLAILFVVFATHRVLRPAIGLPLSLFVGAALAPALQGLLGYMLYRLARDIAKFSFGISVAFAILGVVLLVAIPIGLYMLLMPELPTPS